MGVKFLGAVAGVNLDRLICFSANGGSCACEERSTGIASVATFAFFAGFVCCFPSLMDARLVDVDMG